MIILFSAADVKPADTVLNHTSKFEDGWGLSKNGHHLVVFDGIQGTMHLTVF